MTPRLRLLAIFAGYSIVTAFVGALAAGLLLRGCA